MLWGAYQHLLLGVQQRHVLCGSTNAGLEMAKRLASQMCTRYFWPAVRMNVRITVWMTVRQTLQRDAERFSRIALVAGCEKKTTSKE
jgi:hypothetical protein